MTGLNPGRIVATCAILVVAGIVSCASAEALQGSLGLDFRATASPDAGHPFAVVATDLDGDGRVDLAVTNSRVSKISIRLGKGDGTFEEPFSLTTGSLPRGIAVGDFDRDGKPDLAVAATGRNAVFVHRGTGDGHFGDPRWFAVGPRPFMLTAVDLNQDGAPDLAVANEGATADEEALSILLGDGSGGFSTTSLPSGKWASDVAAADFNRDGKPDLAVTVWGSNAVMVHFGRGDGTFSSVNRLTYPGHGLYSVLAADLDRDGNPDMVWNDLRRSSLYILYGDGRGGFPSTRLLPAGAGVRHAVASDLDGDGWLDLASANTRAGDISIILSDGTGGYRPIQREVVGAFPRTVAAGDLNDDGRPDLVVTSLKVNEVTVLLNEGVISNVPVVPSAAPATTVEPHEEAPWAPPPVLELDSFKYPTGIALHPSGVLLVADQQNHRVAKVDVSTGEITTIAGTGEPGADGDGGPAVGARLNLPNGVAVGPSGHVYIADFGNHRIRKVDASTGVITTVAGTGRPGFSGDGGPATEAEVSHPFGLDVDQAGAIYVADFGNRRVREIDPSGIITTIAGTGKPGDAGDGGPGVEATIGSVTGLASDGTGNLLIADQFNYRIRKLTPRGIITTVAGNGRQGAGGDGGAATAAELSYPAGVGADTKGNVYIADQDGNRIRKVAPSGIIETAAGSGIAGYDGDGGPAAKALLWFPFDVVVSPSGDLFFTDRFNQCIRKVDPRGMITTVAGQPAKGL